MTQRHSQNGWPAEPTPARFARFTAAGQSWWAANADVAVVFKEFIERFDAEVEEITQKTLDDWTYANRLVRGSTSVVSNHGSATAIDVNALQHPRGRRGTFTRAKARQVRAIRAAITDNHGRPVLRLGMDFTTVPDDMHVEIDATPAQVKQAANRIRDRKKAAATAQEDDDMTPAQLKELKADLTKSIAAEIVSQLQTARIVENLPLDEGAEQSRNWTVTEVQAAADRKLDLLRRDVNTILDAVTKTT